MKKFFLVVFIGLVIPRASFCVDNSEPIGHPVDFYDTVQFRAAIINQDGDTIDVIGSGGGVTASQLVDSILAFQNKVDSFKFTTTLTTYPTSKGAFFWNDTTKTIEIVNGDGSRTALGQENNIPVHNVSGVDIFNGDPVYYIASGSDEKRVGLASNLDAYTALTCIGLATTDIPHGDWGRICTFGDVHDLNTSAFDENGNVYLGDGEITPIKPTTGYEIVIGRCSQKHSSNGIISVYRVKNSFFSDLEVLGRFGTSGTYLDTNSVTTDIINAKKYRLYDTVDAVTDESDTVNTYNYFVKPTVDYTGSAYSYGLLDNLEINILNVPDNRIGRAGVIGRRVRVNNQNDSIRWITATYISTHNDTGYIHSATNLELNNTVNSYGPRVKTNSMYTINSGMIVGGGSAEATESISENATNIRIGATIGNYGTSTVGNLKTLDIDPVIISRSGYTTTISDLRLIDMSLRRLLGTGTVNITDMYGIYIENLSTYTGSSNHYGIYENFGPNYFTNSITTSSSVSAQSFKTDQLTGSLTDGAPTDTEIDTIIGDTPANVGAGYFVTIKDNDGSGLLYRIESDGTNWYYVVMTQAL